MEQVMGTTTTALPSKLSAAVKKTWKGIRLDGELSAKNYDAVAKLVAQSQYGDADWRKSVKDLEKFFLAINNMMLASAEDEGICRKLGIQFCNSAARHLLSGEPMCSQSTNPRLLAAAVKIVPTLPATMAPADKWPAAIAQARELEKRRNPPRSVVRRRNESLETMWKRLAKELTNALGREFPESLDALDKVLRRLGTPRKQKTK